MGKRVERMSTLILQRNLNRRFKYNTGGFTLIEIIGVLFLIALIMGIALPGIRSQYRYYIRTSSRELAATFSYLYDQAILTQKTYRIVYDLDENKYWVESSPGNTLITATPEAEESRIEKNEESEKEKSTEEKSLEPQFTKETGKLAKEKKLGKGVVFKDIILPRFSDPITSGIAYTYILPQGYIEETWIHIQDKRNQIFTIKVNPLTGRAQIYRRLVGPNEKTTN